MQISIFGIAIAFVIWLVLGVAILAPVWKRLQDKPHRWRLFGPLLAAVLILPYADELWITWNFHKLCKDAGVHVVRKVEVEGFLDDTSRSSSEHAKPVFITEPSAVNQFDRDGYRFRESLLKDGKVWRVERVEGGLKAEVRDRPTARYHVRFADERHAVRAGFQLERWEMQVVDAETGEIIGTDVKFHRYPGLVEGLWVRFFGSGQTTCEGPAPKPPELRHLLYHYVLIPNK